MKILVISDTHGEEENVRRVLKKEGIPDRILHLGDIEGGEEEIRAMSGCMLDAVSGNCDYFTQLPRVRVVEVGSIRIMMTHGHYHYVGLGTEELEKDARRNHCSVVMFGHTHMPYLNQNDPQLTILNPGSLSQPRQEGHRPSYCMMEIDSHGTAHYEIKYL